MVDHADRGTLGPDSSLRPTCPWCSTVLPTAEVPICPACGAHLVGGGDIELPGVTTIDPAIRALGTAPRKVKRTFGALLVGDDTPIPPPSPAELPALAPPDADVRREMLRIEMDARLAELRADANALAAERGAAVPAAAPPAGAPVDGMPDAALPAGAPADQAGPADHGAGKPGMHGESPREGPADETGG